MRKIEKSLAEELNEIDAAYKRINLAIEYDKGKRYGKNKISRAIALNMIILNLPNSLIEKSLGKPIKKLYNTRVLNCKKTNNNAIKEFNEGKSNYEACVTYFAEKIKKYDRESIDEYGYEYVKKEIYEMIINEFPNSKHEYTYFILKDVFEEIEFADTFEKGEREGMEVAPKAIAHRMIRLNMPKKLIAKCFGTTILRIEELLTEK